MSEPAPHSSIDAKRLFSELVRQLIREQSADWQKVRSDYNFGLDPDRYTNPVAENLRIAAQDILKNRSPGERLALEAMAKAKIPSDALDPCCAALMVSEFMVRAKRVVSRHGYFET